MSKLTKLMLKAKLNKTVAKQLILAQPNLKAQNNQTATKS